MLADWQCLRFLRRMKRKRRATVTRVKEQWWSRSRRLMSSTRAKALVSPMRTLKSCSRSSVACSTRMAKITRSRYRGSSTISRMSSIRRRSRRRRQVFKNHHPRQLSSRRMRKEFLCHKKVILKLRKLVRSVATLSSKMVNEASKYWIKNYKFQRKERTD